MASLTAVREALAAAVSTIPDLQVSAYPLSSPQPPAAHIVPDVQGYHQSFGPDAGELWSWRVQVFLALIEDIGSQRKADEFLDNGAVREAVEADPTLGGLVNDLIVDRAEFRLWEPGGRPMTGAEYFIRLLT